MGWLYATRGCTLFPDGNYGGCCEAHDEAYRTQTGTRRAADEALAECIAAKGRPLVAFVVYYGVRAFGWMRWYWIRAANRKGGRSAA